MESGGMESGERGREREKGRRREKERGRGK